jgi:PAS domain S-box-containing protein
MTDSANQDLYQHIVEDTPDAVIFADREGIIRFWNNGAEEIFGHKRAEVLGQSLDIIVPERLREPHWDGYFRVAETGVTHYGKDLLSVPAIRKDGSRISIEFSIALFKDNDGAVQGFSAILRDMTKSWEEKKALKERLAALEAKEK